MLKVTRIPILMAVLVAGAVIAAAPSALAAPATPAADSYTCGSAAAG